VLILCLALSLPSPAAPGDAVPGLVDAGRPMPTGGPRALIVLDPALQPQAVVRLVDALESEGIDAWLLDAATGGGSADDVVATLLPAARAALPGAALVGAGLGGTLAARVALDEPPPALALLGAPLSFPHSALTAWLIDLDVPADGLDLSTVTDSRWHVQAALPLLLGEPLPPLDRVSQAWLQGLQAWGRADQPVDLTGVEFPVWAGVGDLDELAPAEDVRPWLPPGADFVRFGYLHLDRHPYTSRDLLADPHPAQVLARALAQTLTAAPR